MERLPAPPNPFPVPELPRILGAGSEIWRIYFRSGKPPVPWDKFRDLGPISSSRFDHHLAPSRIQDRAILYATNGRTALRTALAEVFQKTQVIDLTKDDPWLVGFRALRDIRLLDTSGDWPLAAGGSMAINSGSRKDSRAWSREIYRQYTSVEGIWYPSSLIGTACVALYERARSGVPLVPVFHRALKDRAIRLLIKKAARTIRYVIVT